MDDFPRLELVQQSKFGQLRCVSCLVIGSLVLALLLAGYNEWLSTMSQQMSYNLSQINKDMDDWHKVTEGNSSDDVFTQRAEEAAQDAISYQQYRNFFCIVALVLFVFMMVNFVARSNAKRYAVVLDDGIREEILAETSDLARARRALVVLSKEHGIDSSLVFEFGRKCKRV